MDPLHLVEASLKAGRSVVLWGFGYGRQLRDAWVEGLKPDLDPWSARTPAEFDRVVDAHNAEVARKRRAEAAMAAAADTYERARQRLVEQEAEEEVWPGQGCGNDVGEGAEQSSGAEFLCPPRDQDCQAALGGCPCVEHIDGWHVCGHDARFATSVSDVFPAPVGAPTPNSPNEMDDDPAHDDQCESEFIEGAYAYSPCGCDDRATQNLPAGDASPPSPAGTTADVIATVLGEHFRTRHNGYDYQCYTGTLNGSHGRFESYAEWVAHVATIIASRLEGLAADRRIDEQLQASGFRKTTEIFEQHRKAQK